MSTKTIWDDFRRPGEVFVNRSIIHDPVSTLSVIAEFDLDLDPTKTRYRRSACSSPIRRPYPPIGMPADKGGDLKGVAFSLAGAIFGGVYLTPCPPCSLCMALAIVDSEYEYSLDSLHIRNYCGNFFISFAHQLPSSCPIDGSPYSQRLSFYSKYPV